MRTARPRHRDDLAAPGGRGVPASRRGAVIGRPAAERRVAPGGRDGRGWARGGRTRWPVAPPTVPHAPRLYRPAAGTAEISERSGEAGDLDGDAEAGAGRAVVDALERGHVGVVAAAGDDHVAHADRARRWSGRTPIQSPHHHSTQAWLLAGDRVADLAAGERVAGSRRRTGPGCPTARSMPSGQVGDVLADALAQLPGLLGAGPHAGRAGHVLDVGPYPVGDGARGRRPVAGRPAESRRPARPARRRQWSAGSAASVSRVLRPRWTSERSASQPTAAPAAGPVGRLDQAGRGDPQLLVRPLQVEHGDLGAPVVPVAPGGRARARTRPG